MADPVQESGAEAVLDATIFGSGQGYIEGLFEAWSNDSTSVSKAWSDYFATMGDRASVSHTGMLQQMQQKSRLTYAGKTVEEKSSHAAVEFPSRALYLIQAYRVHGHLHANLDPLRLHPPKASPELQLSFYGLGEKDLDTEFPVGDLAGLARMPLGEIWKLLKKTYCGSIGPEFMHITDTARRHWLQDRLEHIKSEPKLDADTRKHIFNRIMKAEEFEHFLHTRYAGQKRFSLEGGESLIPMLDALIQLSGSKGVKEIILGMAHRGRLNVLANVLGKTSTDIFAEFEGTQFKGASLGAGDVKYHLGFSSDIRTAGGTVHLSLGFNPSHLEIITPVVLGSVRARQCRRKDFDRREVMSVLVHGDAAFAGQGVVAESLNLSKLSGFKTGGTIHIVTNNQIGFTVNPFDARSTTYCTDIAKMVQAPILHVNGDDPEACCLAVEIAVEYRRQFREDIVIDLVCYRRHGHNETDSPAVTQPLMYRRIEEHPTLLQIYRKKMVDEGIVTDEEADAMVKWYRECMDELRRDPGREPPSPVNSLQGRWEGYLRDIEEEPDTAVAAGELSELVRRGHYVPPDFTLHPLVQKIFDNRIRMMDGEMPVDWGCAEIMAYATLVSDGGWVRLSGQDSGRGTFFHRHAIVYDQKSGKKHVPLRKLGEGGLSNFIVVDSMLSEEAVMAFEYGYSVAEPRALVIWEAQYGDFANGAQVVIDQFIASGESKWSRMSGLVLWLPHGYEGQGAEHSSARLERYLQLCAEDNMQVVYPTTPAQLFHLLRRQYMIRIRKPLVIMSPKSMLRQKLSFSSLNTFIDGRFEPVLPEAGDIEPSTVSKLLLCSGKVYYDLLAARDEAAITDIAIIRIERLYPFPSDALSSEMAKYASAEKVVWVQEEPQNQGAWYQIRHSLKQCLQPAQRISYITRPALAAPAVGSARRHAEEQQSVVQRALKREPAK
ncbi:MAG: 2-oxoglutarate dehydrogenase E1 component [Mariprofundaceae bacterium]|nr:2-oxoglutarate dehydrogenase E1 component [Mariprofundaceae bacterium]